MLSRVLSGAVHGISGYLVKVEVDAARGLPSFSTVGLPQGAVKEGRERVLAAIKNSGYEVPPRRITVNLAPAAVRKEGTGFDLPIAIGILASTGQISVDPVRRILLIGELGLDGSLRPVRGILPIVINSRNKAVSRIVLPVSNLREARMVGDVESLGAESLAEVAAYLDGRIELSHDVPPRGSDSSEAEAYGDFADVVGQEHAKRALEVAAAGMHNMLMIGSPGSGKTMLARRLPTVLPPLTVEASLEATRIHSVAGNLPPVSPMIRRPPFRAPHHTVSDVGLIGGGATPRPGEISLAHNGVLFLDELPEFRRSALEALRQPLEDHRVSIARAGFTVTFPSRFLLVATMNPCPCGFLTDPVHDCSCPPQLVRRYVGRVSGPLLDRIDIHVEMPPVERASIGTECTSESSGAVAERVARARAIQSARFHGREGVEANAHMRPGELRAFCRMEKQPAKLLETAMSRLGLSARAYHRVLRVGRTIADLAGAENIETAHIAEAIQYRSLDRAPRL